MTLPLTHLAVSPDGSRRWARARGLPPEAGYTGAAHRLMDLLGVAGEEEIEYVSVHLLNRANLARPAAESTAVLDQVEELVQLLEPRAVAGEVAVTWVGHRFQIPADLGARIEELERVSCASARISLALYIDYDAAHELLQAGGDLDRLEPRGFPAVDLYIRTSSDLRTSGFDPLRLMNAELIYAPGGFPQFGPTELRAAISEYALRDRRLGR